MQSDSANGTDMPGLFSSGTRGFENTQHTGAGRLNINLNASRRRNQNQQLPVFRRRA
jgi:hypothetical protein